MSSSFGYLIPQKSFETEKFKEAIISIFQNQKIINGYYEEAYQWYAAGEKSYSIFSEKEDGTDPAFEYLEIHDTVNSRIIPDCTTNNYGAKCLHCKTNLDEILSETLSALADTESESGEESDMSLLVILCEHCKHTNKLKDIQFDIEVKFAKQFVCFVEIDCEFDDKKLSELALQLNSELKIIYGDF